MGEAAAGSQHLRMKGVGRRVVVCKARVSGGGLEGGGVQGFGCRVVGCRVVVGCMLPARQRPR